MLIKVATASGSRTQIREMVDVFRGKIVDIAANHVIVELSGSESKLTAFVDLMRPFGIIEMVRTGRVALGREISLSIDAALEPPPTYEEAALNG